MQHSSVFGVTAWLSIVAGSAYGQNASPDGAFELAKEVPADVAAKRANVRPDLGQAVRVHWDAMTTALAAAPMEDTPAAPITLTLPMPDGSWARFAVVESPVMHPDLAAVMTGVKTYAGQGLDDPASTVRLDYTPHGFHAQVFSEFGSWYIDPYSFEDTSIVTSYWKRDLQPQGGGWQCHEDELDEVAWTPGYVDRAIVTRRTFDLAVAGTVEYCAFHGNTQALAQAAVVTAVNRVTQIYERDLAVRFTLVANNINLMFIGTDIYDNTGTNQDLTDNQTNCDTIIGSANYDIGHLFETGNGGVAQLSSVCVNGSKARGLSGLPSPINDPFTIDYVAHEMGHQFAGRHCFNNCGGGAGDSQTYAFEPGSGVTIMAYAGICGSTNLQSNSDAMFHSGSIDLMAAFVAGRTCDAETSSGNNTPTVNGGPDYTIPRQTPFALTATGNDVDGDAITYSWEQRDTASGVVALGTDNGTNPIQRTWLPSTSPVRTLPRLSNLLNNTLATGEMLPQVARTSLDYRVVARDNRLLNGGIATDNVVIVVNGTAGPFLVTSPNTNVAWSGVRTATWNVAGTTAAPVSCANVKISLSTDGGNTWPTVLVASTPNDGTESVTLPNITTSQARIKVESVGNIFFDISNTNFSISPALGVAFGGTGVNVASDAVANGNNNTRIDPGESNIAVTVQMVNSGGQAATGVTGTLTSLTGTASIVSGASAYANMAIGVPQTNATPFVVAVDPSHVCGAPINLRLSMNSAQGSGTYDFSFPTGLPGGSGTQTFSYAGPAVGITDNDPVGISVPLVVSGFTGSLTDVNLRFDGAACSAAIGSTTVGLDHTYVGDLIVTLTAPAGSPSVVIVDRPGVPASQFGNSGNNFCQTIIDDEGTLGTIEDAAVAAAPFGGSWTPNSPLGVFDGINPNGTWTLTVSDNEAADTGSLRSFSLVVTGASTTTCEPPLPPIGCDGDVNCDFALDGFDVEVQEKAVGGDTTDYCQADPDFNGDFALDGFDVEAVEIVVGGGPCP